MKESQKYLKTEAISHVENVVFCQLGSYCDIMQGFNIKFSKIKRLIQQEAKKYKIPKADLEILLANVDPKLSQSLEQEKSKEVLRGIPS